MSKFTKQRKANRVRRMQVVRAWVSAQDERIQTWFKKLMSSDTEFSALTKLKTAEKAMREN